MTIRELIQRVSNLYSKGTPSDDSRLTNRHIYNKLLTVRSRLLSQELNKRRKVSRWSYQQLPCVELIHVNSHNCSCLPYIGCKLLRSKYKLPKALLSYNTHTINSVTSVVGDIVYSPTTFEATKSRRGNRYTKDKPSYYILDGYLYTTYSEGPLVISILGLFEDPNEVLKFPKYCKEDNNDNTNSNTCLSILDSEFPIEADLLDAVVEMSINELVNIFSQMREDKSNDSSDSLLEQSK